MIIKDIKRITKIGFCMSNFDEFLFFFLVPNKTILLLFLMTFFSTHLFYLHFIQSILNELAFLLFHCAIDDKWYIYYKLWINLKFYDFLCYSLFFNNTRNFIAVVCSTEIKEVTLKIIQSTFDCKQNLNLECPLWKKVHIRNKFSKSYIFFETIKSIKSFLKIFEHNIINFLNKLNIQLKLFCKKELVKTGKMFCNDNKLKNYILKNIWIFGYYKSHHK